MAFSIPLFENILAPKTQPLGSPCPFFLDGPPRDARDLASAPTGPWDSEAQAPAAAVGRHEGSPPLTLSIPEASRVLGTGLPWDLAWRHRDGQELDMCPLRTFRS